MKLPVEQATPGVKATLVAEPAPVSAARSLQGRAQALRTQIEQVVLPRALWSVSRTGRSGLIGIGLIATSLVFLVSTYVPMTHEIQQLNGDLGVARAHAAAVRKVAVVSDSPQSMKNLPKRTEVPDLLANLLSRADAAQLSIDTAKYEVTAGKAGAIVRYQVAFPVSGSYPKVREFIDQTLTEMPALSLDEFNIQRKSIADPVITAQITMTLFTRGTP
jgi:hypothetical protein